MESGQGITRWVSRFLDEPVKNVALDGLESHARLLNFRRMQKVGSLWEDANPQSDGNDVAKR